ncbi:hypothetical protein AB0L82_35370 [Nocardia sp. NPDC052001]|uniref:hypothetical protein n=1 Tax=Nocardia sp. NPDC052001 TaxID=3154853 RepID=UPI00341BB232
MTSRELPRHYHVWDAHDYRMVVAGCLEGLSDEQIAVRAGRTVAALRDRGGYFVDPVPGNTCAAWSRLREELTLNPEYDWEATVRRRHAAEQLPYWDEAGDALLRRTWEQSAPTAGPGRWLRGRGRRESRTRMADLEEDLGIHEFEIAKRLRYLKLAQNIVEVAERLGARDDGVLAARARMLSDRLAVTLWLLIVTDESGGVLSCSLHPTQDAAVTAKDAAAQKFRKHPLAVWTICGRSVGDGVIGDESLTGDFDTGVAPVVNLDELDFG